MTHKDGTISKSELESFLEQVPSLPEVVENHSQLVAHFGYFLTEKLGETDVTSKRIRACYDAASISTPANITDAMRKSRAFVRTISGTTLNRNVRKKIKESLQLNGTKDAVFNPDGLEKNRRIVVVHGRDLRLRDSMFQFLRSVGLSPIEWNEAVRRTQRGSPYTGEIVDALFRDAQAVVVLLSPDEHVELRSDLKSQDSTDDTGWQPRPNVFIEAGMALARDEAHTLFVEIGRVRNASDLLGRNVIHFDGSSPHRHDLIERLRTAGCALSTTGNDWLRVGTFEIPRKFTDRGGKAR